MKLKPKPKIYRVSYLIWAMDEEDALINGLCEAKITEVIEFKLEAS